MILNTEVWKKLESECPKGERITARLVFPEKSRKLYVGFDSDKQRHLLISLNEKEEDYQDLQSKGFSITTRELVVKNAAPHRYIDIVCHDPAGYVIFDVMGSEIGEKIDSGNSKEIIIQVISKWRNFLGRTPRDLLSHNELVGIFAELWFLYYWLLPKTKKMDAINKWRSPFLSRHDFEWTGSSVEVKATTNAHSRVHKINGLEQLSPPKDGKLFLFSLRLREENGADATLPGIINLCREELRSDIEALSKFENMIAALGYSPLHDDEYCKIKFRIIDEKLYEVTKDFPRLVPDLFKDGMPLGVGAVEYTVNLDGYDGLCIAKSPNDGAELLIMEDILFLDKNYKP